MNKNLEIVQSKSKEIGHCVCSKCFTCPCNYFTQYNLCKCAGDKINQEEWLKFNLNKNEYI